MYISGDEARSIWSKLLEGVDPTHDEARTRMVALLVRASEVNNLDAVQYLLSLEVDPRHPDSDGWLPLVRAVAPMTGIDSGKHSAERIRMVRALVGAGADIHEREPCLGKTPLESAVAQGSPEMVEELIRLGARLQEVPNSSAESIDLLLASRERHSKKEAARVAEIREILKRAVDARPAR